MAPLAVEGAVEEIRLPTEIEEDAPEYALRGRRVRLREQPPPEDGAPPAPKRPRGRPRKHPLPDAPLAVEGAVASEDDVRCQACRGRHVRHTCGKGKHGPPKKPRVRPPREPVIGPKRPRGRPRKHPLPDAPLAVEGAVEERFRILTEIERATSGEAKLLLGLASAVTPSSSPPPRPRSDSSSSSEPSAAPTTLRTVGIPFKTKAKVAKVGKTVPYRREVTVIRVPPPPPPTPREMFVAKCLEFSRKVAREFPPGCPAFALYKLAITAQRADHAGRCAVVARLRELFRTDAEVTEMFFDLLSPGLRAEFQVD